MSVIDLCTVILLPPSNAGARLSNRLQCAKLETVSEAPMADKMLQNSLSSNRPYIKDSYQQNDRVQKVPSHFCCFDRPPLFFRAVLIRREVRQAVADTILFLNLVVEISSN
ncbi:uncharacterized protein BDCG_16181 [Blastomyces dermatitidis ER-3]|uniref:Uncharacterized protein n=1 Tax=Ajellomyces dermatitidis (strain ER-3 / ATCC MYA-2586) TaxID=559297 RepID=A0ABX2VQJ9_AJEDR|nr:uncharacterized protein BDCG_16181 [Blastomyces dermatitidis ER-3]OAS99523.1 hypothetical protein BDCG_16181 [Blastomyces dermatitidis ER-3]